MLKVIDNMAFIYSSYHDLRRESRLGHCNFVALENNELLMKTWALKSGVSDKVDVVVYDVNDGIKHIFVGCEFADKEVFNLNRSRMYGKNEILRYEKHINVFAISRSSKKIMQLCEKVARNSNCRSAKIGSVVVKNRRVVGKGWCGPPFGFCGDTCPRIDMGYKSGEGIKYCPSFHSEQRAVASAGKKANGAVIYMTCGLPCYRCMKSIAIAGIKRVVCGQHNNSVAYDNDYMFSESVKIANENGIEIVYMGKPKKGDRSGDERGNEK